MPDPNFTPDELEALTDALDIAFGDNDGKDLAVEKLRQKLNDYALGVPPMITVKTMRELLREHQTATGCDDNQMVEILCDYIERVDNWDVDRDDIAGGVIPFVVEKLEQGPPS